MQKQIAALTAQQATDALRGKVAAALADGRLLPAMQGWAEAQLAGTADQRAALSSYIDAAVPLPALAGSQTAALAAAGGAGGAGAPAQAAALTANEIAVCDALGIDHAAYSAQKAGGAK
jgi:phage I-like protein